MAQHYLSVKLMMWPLLQEQTDSLRSKKLLKVNNYVLLASQSSSVVPTLEEVIDCIYEFLNLHTPPLELERLLLKSNHILNLLKNFASIGAKLTYLDLHNNSLSNFPKLLSGCSKLEVLDLLSNLLSNLPSDIAQLKSIKALSLQDNRFKYIPPVLGHMDSLNLIEVADNPLIAPLYEKIKSFQRESSENDWVLELKAYLVANSEALEKKLLDPHVIGLSTAGTTTISTSVSNASLNSTLSGPPSVQPPQQPNSSQLFSRLNSLSDTRNKALRAARRMGLIIKKPEEESTYEKEKEKSVEPPSGSGSLDKFSGSLTEKPEQESPESIGLHLSTLLTTTAISQHYSSQQQPRTQTLTIPVPENGLLPTSPPNSSLGISPRPTSRSRSRSNTLKEIDRILEKSDTVDTEHKSGAYFRRLLTLQEMPLDELIVLHKNSKQNQSVDSEDKPPPPKSSKSPSDSPTRSAPKKIHHDTSTIVQISRKILFLFSELHLSIRRFTGFCVDKKVTIKMVSLLYNTKLNIDTLVENLELMEDKGDNIDQILDALKVSISSFRAIMQLLSENLSNFVSKIDVCFIRMLYLTVYGSFNELANAFKVIKSEHPSFSGGVTTLDPKHKTVTAVSAASNGPPLLAPIQTNMNSNVSSTPTSVANNSGMNGDATPTPSSLVEIDEKLYVAVSVATNNAKLAYTEIGKALAKANANPRDGTIMAKVNDLTSVCNNALDISKRLTTKLITIRNNPSMTTKQLFYEEMNFFFKATLQMFYSVKEAMKEIPVLHEVRSSMAALSKASKEVTLLVDASSYRLMSESYTTSATTAQPPLLTTLPSVSNIFTPLIATPQISVRTQSLNNLSGLVSTPAAARTPVVATMGHAAQNMPFMGGDSPMNSPGITTEQLALKLAANPFDGLILAKEREREREREKRAAE